LVEIDSENPDAIRLLREFIKSCHPSWERLQAASALGKTPQYKQEAINVLCELISKTIQRRQDRQLWQQAFESFKQLDLSSLDSFLSCQRENFSSKGIVLSPENVDNLMWILALLKHYMEEEDYIEESYYEDIWHCARTMNYRDFYHAWHSQVYSTRTEECQDITVVEFNTVQALDSQLIDISSQVQPTDKIYP
jgi:hypothetical protein